MQYNLISADCHIDLRWMPHDAFVSNAPDRWKSLVPQLVEAKDGNRWYAEGKDIAALRLPGGFKGIAKTEYPKRGVSRRYDRMHEAGFYDGKLHATTPELRIKDQQMDGVDAEVIYGILGIGRVLENRELLRVVYQIYNTWVADFCKTNPERLVGLACIPNDDPEAAGNELRRVAKLGLKGGEFDVSTAIKPVWHRDWDPLWAAVDECNMAISFHATGVPVRQHSDDQMAMDYRTQYDSTYLTLLQIAGSEYLASIVFSGALERYPGMKFVLAECGVGWIPYVLARMDEEYKDKYHHLNFSLNPGEYWRRQGYTTFQHDTILADLVHLVGEEDIMWGSDYPHGDGLWPDSRKSIEAYLGRLDAGVRRKITCENAGKLYGLIA